MNDEREKVQDDSEQEQVRMSGTDDAPSASESFDGGSGGESPESDPPIIITGGGQ